MGNVPTTTAPEVAARVSTSRYVEGVTTPARVPELDGIRGVAAFAIVLWHYIPSINVRDPGTIYSYLDRLLSLCWSGVDLFFVLSGFLIGSILLREKEARNFFQTFYIRRAARIVPLYALMLGLFALGGWWVRHGAPSVVTPLFAGKVPSWSYLVFVQNFFMPGVDHFGAQFLTVTWSLAIEEQFYLLLPLIIYFLPRRRLGWLLVLLCAAAPLLRTRLEAGLSTYVLLPCRLDSLMAGALVALIWQETRWRNWIVRRRVWLFVMWIVLAIPCLPLLRSGAGLHALLTGPWHSWINSWLAIWFALTLVLVLSGHFLFGKIFRLPLLRWLGLRAYGLYLLHLPMLWLAHIALLGNEPILKDARTAGATFVAIGLSLFAAAVAYRWIEEPFKKLGHRFKYYDEKISQSAV